MWVPVKHESKIILFFQFNAFLFFKLYPQTSTSNHPITLPDLLRRIVQITPPICRLMHHLAHYVHTVAPSIWQPLYLPEPRPTDRNGSQMVDLFSYLRNSRHFAGGFKVHDDFFVFIEDDDWMRGEVDYLHLSDSYSSIVLNISYTKAGTTAFPYPLIDPFLHFGKVIPSNLMGNSSYPLQIGD